LTGCTPGKARKKASKPTKGDRTTTDEAAAAEAEPLPQCILFVSRCKTAAHLSAVFTELDVPNTPLHSHLTQKQRLASLDRFRASGVPLLIATDVGSRGLDIPAVQVVINWDLPREPDDYIHRVGRTARAGKGGVAVSIITEGDVDLISAIEARVGAKMEELPLPEEKVLEGLNRVSTAQRMATVHLRSEKAGERADVNRKKSKLMAKALKPKADRST
jgi:ATP-dependent RNA helicase DDX49/DBP8